MTIPLPKFKQGDRVQSIFERTRGVVLSRQFDNLIHASAWTYRIAWDTDKVTSHHCCYDLEAVPR